MFVLVLYCTRQEQVPVLCVEIFRGLPFSRSLVGESLWLTWVTDTDMSI